ncbi:hypothetical protein L7F22_029046 [Adiantum nelumboides]|nr:hypothetical protein [Adiantum nelumboides]
MLSLWTSMGEGPAFEVSTRQGETFSLFCSVLVEDLLRSIAEALSNLLTGFSNRDSVPSSSSDSYPVESATSDSSHSAREASNANLLGFLGLAHSLACLGPAGLSTLGVWDGKAKGDATANHWVRGRLDSVLIPYRVVMDEIFPCSIVKACIG